MCVFIPQSCMTLCNLMHYSLPGILQARILEWVAIPFSRGSSQPRNRPLDFCIADRFFVISVTRVSLELNQNPWSSHHCFVLQRNKWSSVRLTHSSMFIVKIIYLFLLKWAKNCEICMLLSLRLEKQEMLAITITT